ncbi:MAG: thioredoxin family protein [Verrucomicrobia bacterium]|nr:thioredoxin family protein [Verrucomicrobiota bacterium]
MRLSLRLCATLLMGVAGLSANAATTTQVRLLLSAETARAGDTVMAGVRLKMAAGWHTYWRNPGGPGIATSITWQLPQGVSAGEIQWPLPEKLTISNETSYVYNDEVVLLVPLKLAPDLKPGPLELKAKVSWLECEDTCIPGNTNVSTKLLVASELKPSSEVSLVEKWRNKLPKSSDRLSAIARWEKPSSSDMRPVIMEWTTGQTATDSDFFPYANEQIEVQSSAEQLTAEAGKIRLRKQVKKLEWNWPRQLQGILVAKEDGKQLSWEVNLPIENSSGGDAASTPFSWVALLTGLGLAFLGGLILNIMPCVLPVIALKVFSFVKQSGEAPGRARRLSFIYAFGILCSFLVLAGFLIAAQKAGEVVSWGMQMQNRNFVIGMTILVTLVALNLFGLFEVTLGGGAMSATDALTRRSGASGAFFNGVLATALAIPCTAPFLAGALTFAFAQPPLIVLWAFSFIALGLAAPYIVLTWNPALLKFLPKPGPWMLRFKVALGFPMLATVVWLYKLSLNHLNKSQSLWFGIFLVTVAMAAWIWGEFVQRGGSRRGLAVLITLLLLGTVGGYAVTRHEGIKWQKWSQAAVEKARADGHSVLVDFTADWCLTCQLNLRTSIDVPKVRAKLADAKAVTLMADYTLQDELIGKELHRFGRDAVPLVVVFPKNPNAEPIVLPPLLRPQIVLDALEKATK